MYKLLSFEFTEFLAFLCFYFQSRCLFFVEMLSEVITVFSQFRGNILTNLLWSLYPWHLCRGVYSFRLSVRMFVQCLFVQFVLPSVAWNLRQSFAKFLKWCISQQLLIRKNSYLDHSYPVGLAFIP